MTSQGLISDGQAREIAQGQVDQGLAHPGSALGLFAATGGILEQLARAAATGTDDMLHPSIRVGDEFWAYVSHHGERTAQPGWSER